MRGWQRLSGALVAVALLAGVALAPGPAAVAQTAPAGFVATFDGAASGAPQTWRPAGWLNSNYASVMDPYTMPTTVAGHGADCAAPPANHLQSGTPADAYFLCRDHVMTTGQQSMRLTIVPPVVTDVRGTGATVSWDASTLGSSERDWQEIWLVPYEDDFPVTGDFERAPQRGVKIVSHLPSKTDCQNCGWFGVTVVRDGREVWQAPCCGDLFTSRTEVSAARRDTFELRVSQTRLSFTEPTYGLKWADTALPPGLVDWGTSLVSIHHAAYSPSKGGDCPADQINCGHNTWHWDNLRVSPATPLTVRDPQARLADATAPALTFSGPAAPGSLFRGWVMGGGWQGLQHSTNDGASWEPTPIYRGDGTSEHMQALKFPVPDGTQQVRFRKADGGNFVVGDPRLVAVPGATSLPTATAAAPSPSPSPSPSPTPTASPAPTGVPSTATAAPVSATPVPPTPSAEAACEVRVRIGGQETWVAKPAAFCQE